MTPDLSRRLAWVLNVTPLPPASRLDFLNQVATAQSFEDLPPQLAKFVLDAEKRYGTNPNL